ncbi:MAG: hypothetical protein WCG87_08830 [Bacteroidota bacterium]
MASGIKKLLTVLKWSAALLLILIAISIFNYKHIVCYFATLKPGRDIIENGIHRQENPQNIRMVDSGIHMLHTGDMVLRTGADATSYMLCQMNRSNKTYSHCGLVSIENGYPFVYHCIGGEDNPNELLRRDSAGFFFSPANNLGFGIVSFDLSDTQKKDLSQVARHYYIQGIKFDMDFDMKTDDKLYCAEFIYKSIQQVTHDSSYFTMTHFVGRTYVSVDNLFESPHAKRVCEIRFK